MRDPNRAIFYWEHVLPVRNIVKGVLSQNTAEGIVEVLLTAEVAWILREENKRLTHKNRLNPREDYARAGIVLD